MILFDSNILVAGAILEHPSHRACSNWLRRAKVGTLKACVTQHGLAETFAVMTRLPHGLALSPTVAERILTSFGEFLEAIRLEPEDYWESIARLASSELSGGVIFDQLHIIAAEKLRCEALLTRNLKHFQKLVKARPLELIDPISEPSPQ